MVSGVYPGQGPEPIRQSESPKERQKIFELQFEISVIGAYLAVSQKNGSLTHRLESIAKDLKSGKSPEQLAPLMNQLLKSLETQFPSFELTSISGEQKAMSHFIETFQNYLNVAVEKQQFDLKIKTQLDDEAQGLKQNVKNQPFGVSIDKFNQLIHIANQNLRPNHQIELFGKSSLHT